MFKLINACQQALGAGHGFIVADCCVGLIQSGSEAASG